MYIPTIKDTIRRLQHAGRLITLSEDSEFVKLVDNLMSLDRDRLDKSILSTKKVLSDWAGAELDNWWGTLISLDRLPGVDDVSDFLGDSTYVSRIRRFMEAGNSGISLESVRMAAESGAGVPMRARNALGRIILEPLEPISPPQKAGALRAARKIAPARAVIEIATAENFAPETVKNAYSPSVYIGPTPEGRMEGSRHDSPNYVAHAVSNIWDRAPEGSLFPTDGLPGNAIKKGGAWHTTPLGFGQSAVLIAGIQDEPVNRVKFSISRGTWLVDISGENGDSLHSERIIIGEEWYVFSRVFKFVRENKLFITIKNTSQEVRDVFLRGLYVGARVNPNNREQWLALGGLKGSGEQEKLVVGDARNVLSGGEWISLPTPSSRNKEELYATLGGIPRRVEALQLKTTTPGCIFEVYFSNENIVKDEDYLKAQWVRVAGLYELKNGRVSITPFVGQHIKLVFSNLRPMLMRDYQDEEEVV